MPKYKFKEGDQVAHLSSLKLKLFVERILFRTVQIPEKDNSKKFTNKSLISGIVVTFKDPGTGTLRKEKFHSNLLVPWTVAEKGEDFVSDWLKRNK